MVLSHSKGHWVSNDCNLWSRTNLFSSSFASLSKIPGYFLFIMVFVTIIHFCLLRFLNWIAFFKKFLLPHNCVCDLVFISVDNWWWTNKFKKWIFFFPRLAEVSTNRSSCIDACSVLFINYYYGIHSLNTTLSNKILYFHVPVTFTNINTTSPIFWTYEHLCIEHSYTFLGWYLD